MSHNSVECDTGGNSPACRKIETHGPALQSASQLEHVAHPLARHHARESRSLRSAPDGLPLPSARQESSGQTGHRAAQVEDGHLRAWLLLASAREVQVRLHAQNEQAVLECEVWRQSDTRCARQEATSSNWLASHRGMGMRQPLHCSTQRPAQCCISTPRTHDQPAAQRWNSFGKSPTRFEIEIDCKSNVRSNCIKTSASLLALPGLLPPAPRLICVVTSQ